MTHSFAQKQCDEEGKKTEVIKVLREFGVAK